MKRKSEILLKCGAAVLAALQVAAGCPLQADARPEESSSQKTTTPIKHVIVIIGENRTFDHLFATYKPRGGQHVWNLLSRGIINADGTPGPNYAYSAQYSAVDSTGSYTNSPQQKNPYAHIPPIGTGGAPTAANDDAPPTFQTLRVAKIADTGLAAGYEKFLLTGATGLKKNSLDTRFRDQDDLREGVFPITPSIGADDYAASPVHRFFQMWQQVDCNARYATEDNPSGCLKDLFPWVETSVGAGSNGKPLPAGFNSLSTGEGSTAMGFYNMQRGDEPYLRELADDYTLSDNYHQAVMGGTGANHIFLGYGDALYYSDGKGHATRPPWNQIENPDPQPGTDNYYKQDGYSGGSYVNCADGSQPGVEPIRQYLGSLNRPAPPNCQANHYYLVNNYNPGYLADGSLGAKTSKFTIPPSSVRGIGDALMEKNISFKWYGEGWDLYSTDPAYTNPYNQYCNICNIFQYSTSIMANAKNREEHISDTTQLYEDLATGNLPAVSYVKPDAFNDGHPGSSKVDLFEGFVKKVVDNLQANPELWKTTAVFVTVDEGGGYYDSGYIQPLDFFGDGTRIPLLVISPYSRGGRVVHQYYDHVSILKFIERNWQLKPLTDRSRDNLPNPRTAEGNPYVPTNGPAIGDLMEMFNFHDRR
ncbi:alkaline phosphatase family protein [Acidipila rosea]|uniref:Phospholipase C n=1 Tax=Acidipila rosea TaxID=768535 RepID=A0A4R1L1T5_9BACT|nr:alkaline phosphatase family protein [Acidipila rosea]TCK71938.1 phospholipase C [Acidipila rosea]